MADIDSKRRFSDRVDNYVKYRPDYPAEALDRIAAFGGLGPGSAVADVGAGTGKLTRLLLERGWRVWAVEPNANMRAAAEQTLSGFPGFTPVAASAEETTLPDASVNLVTVAQAFHWFDRAACRAEFRRILKPGGGVALIWNQRGGDSAFMQGYTQAVRRWCGDHPASHNRVDDDACEAFFGGPYEKTRGPVWSQSFDFEGLWGRALSNSTTPLPGHPRHEPFKAALRELFAQYSEDGAVHYDYQTELVLGRL
ncbi:MAG: class I SAM-dependent methyltransferase [Oscillospiraceae bacterium]|jgi:SAM-dependent methyltransferase|nr:class I SAM-dependent methyltransferase [Oscillospiraceae bacterium]